MTENGFNAIYAFIGSVVDSCISVDTERADHARSELFAARISAVLSVKPRDADER